MLILRAATKLWLRRYRKKQATPMVRAVLLGDGVSTRVITDGVFAGHELDALRRHVFPHLKGRGTALDIGANIGNHAAAFSAAFDRVFAFEINKVVFHILQSNAVGKGITPVHVGLSDQTGELPFVEEFENMGASRIAGPGEAASHHVQVTRLDDYVQAEGLDDVSFVKVDVEGHEAQVFAGGAAFFGAVQPVLAFESLYAGGSAPEGDRVEAMLRGYGYDRFWEMVPESGAMRRMAGWPKAVRNVVKLFIPRAAREALVLSPIDRLSGANRELVVASAFALG